MAKPTTYYPWGLVEGTYTIVVKGISHTVPYKHPPLVGDSSHDFTSKGILFKTRVPSQYINWQMNGAYLWVSHLDQRIVVGDVQIIGTPKTQTQVNEQLGGNWTQIGFVTETWGTNYYWKKLS